MKRVLLALFVLLFILTAPASASRLRLAIIPDPAHVGEANIFSGCGYVPLVPVKYYLTWNPEFKHLWSNGGPSVNVLSNAAGCISVAWTPTSIGLYNISTFEPNHGDWQFRGRIIFEITS